MIPATVWLVLVPVAVYTGIVRFWQVPAGFAILHAIIALLYRRRTRFNSERPAA